ncbi:MAG: glycosyltransferase family 39 protein [Chloroflexota bacterium]
MRRYFKLCLLLVVFTAGVLAHQLALPVMEGNDETMHYNYITWLRMTWRLPNRAANATNMTRQESGQPPLTYWVAAHVFDLLQLPHNNIDLLRDMETARNPWFTPPNWWNRRDNFNQYFHGIDEKAFGQPDIVTGDRVARLLSLGYGLIAVLGAYGSAREFFDSDGWALTATAFFAFTPQMLYICAMFSNDVSATAFATLAIWQTLRLLKRGASPLRLVAIGVLVALAGLSKVSAMIILPGILLAIFFAGRNQRLPIKRLLLKFLLLGVVIALIFGPWVVYGVVTFHDPFGLRTHEDTARAQLPAPTPLQMLAEVPSMYLSYWGKFGSASIWMTPVAYLLFTGIVIFSLWGYVGYLRRHRLDWRSLVAQQAAVTGVILLAALLAWFYWLITLYPIAYAITGRLIYFVHGLVAVALTGGLFLFAQQIGAKWAVWLRISAIGSLMGAGMLVVPITVWTTFAPPHLITRDQLPTLKGNPVDFDKTIRFLGYSVETPTVRANSLYTVKLCWEVLKPTNRAGAFGIKLFDEVANQVGGRTSVHGMGHFNSILWNAGDIFCDDVDIPLKGPFKPAQVYNVILNVIDIPASSENWQATTPDGQKIDEPLIFQAVSLAGDMAANASENWQPTPLVFPQFADLKGFSVEGVAADGMVTPGQKINLHLLWEVKGETPDNWMQFIHLIGSSTALSLADIAPRNGLYPTWAWTHGEKIVDDLELTLPADLKSGSYTLQIGFVNPANNQRMPVLNENHVVPDSSSELLTLKVR